MPDLEKVLDLRSAADSLAQYLLRELRHLEYALRSPEQMKQVYDAVYLPRTTGLADGLAHFDIPDLDVLRSPLCSDLAATQMCVVLEILFMVTFLLNQS